MLQRIFTLESIFWSIKHKRLYAFTLMLGAALLLGIVSQLSVPLDPVPLTFQSVTVLLIGMSLGARLGTGAIILYLIAGALGLPVFANFSGGLSIFTGPTGGYLIGFLPAVWISGYLAQYGFAKNSWLSFIATMIGTLIIFAFGVGFLANMIGWSKAFNVGIKPFLLSELIKSLLLALIVPRCWKMKQ